MIIEQEGRIVHPIILRQFLHNTASCRIILDGRSTKFHFGELGHLDFWQQYVETFDYAREFSCSEANVNYLGLHRVNIEAYPPKSSDVPLHIAEDRFRGAADSRVIVKDGRTNKSKQSIAKCVLVLEQIYLIT